MPRFTNYLIGLRAKEARLSAGLTVNEVAKAMDISKCKLDQVESGTYRLGTWAIMKLADVLNVSLEWLILGKPQSGSEIALEEKTNHLKTNEKNRECESLVNKRKV
jgi:transcriptional regulator with XRE-family HTH domain